MRFIVDAATKANQSADKPNEDYYLVDEVYDIFIVADGVTRDRIDGKYPNPSPARHRSEKFVHTTHDYLVQVGSDPPEYLKYAVSAANSAIRRDNAGYTSFPPGTVGIVALIEDDTLHYVYIGDCSVYVVDNGKVKRLTTPQTKRVHEHQRLATKEERLSSDVIRNQIANNPEHPLRYGVLNGDERAIHFLEYHQLSLKAGMIVIIASDGLDILFERPDFTYQVQSADQLIAQAEQIENDNQQIRSDDKTVIVLKIHE